MRFIHGFGLSGYRSFGAGTQFIGPCSDINLLIGQNNSGKSNVLSFLNKHFKEVVAATFGSSKWNANPDLDRHIGSGQCPFKFSLGLPLGDLESMPVFRQAHAARALQRHEVEFTLKVLDCLQKEHLGDLAWFDYESHTIGENLGISGALMDRLVGAHDLPKQSWHQLNMRLRNTASGDHRRLISDILPLISPNSRPVPPIELIPAIRRVGLKGSIPDGWDGQGVIERLAQLQNPEHTAQGARVRFNEITEFIRTVLDSPTAWIEVPHSRETIVVHMDNRSLPIESLGTGIHEVIIIAAACTVVENSIICIEEPELHMHPVLQRKLIKYLKEKMTSNQYFISTHSAHLINTDHASLFHVRLVHGSSQVERVQSPVQRAVICAELGYRPSDLVQANCIIWVEGPTDWIYIRHWIKSVDPNLIEGTDYSIMFYGGRLLSHLTANDPEVEEFISLRRLNRYAAILIDSDRRSPRASLNNTKIRVRDSFDAGPGFAWITAGREIENYIPNGLLRQAIHSAHDQAVTVPVAGKYENALRYRAHKGRKDVERVDKMKVARAVAQVDADLSALDLRKQVRRLVNFIREANGQASLPVR